MAPLWIESAHPLPAEAISGACLLIKRAFFEEVGGFDETYFMYGEDLDLCFRLTKAGHRSYYIPTTTLIHFGGASSDQAVSCFSTVMMRISVRKFIRTHAGVTASLCYQISSLLSAFLRIVLVSLCLLFGRRILPRGSSALKKWIAIFKWSLGFPFPFTPKPSQGEPATSPS